VGVPGLGEGAEPPESDMMMAVVCPSGPIRSMSMSAGLPWVMLFSFTVTLVIEPGIPPTKILEGYGEAGPEVPVDGIVIDVGFVKVSPPHAVAYSSEVFSATPTPPATSTWSEDSNVAVCSPRPTLRKSVGPHVPVAGSYSSQSLPKLPPATNTLPEGSSVAVYFTRPLPRLPVAVHMPVVGSYSSALRKAVIVPPATSTLPVCSRVAVKKSRATVMLPVAVHIPVTGSYSSALLR